MRRANRFCISATLLCILALAGCASVGQGLAVSGESLKAVGNEFIAVAEVYQKGCAAQTIKPESCAAFRTFGLRFQAAYPIAVGLWTAARNANDAAAAKHAEAVIASLATDLSGMASIVLSTLGGK